MGQTDGRTEKEEQRKGGKDREGWGAVERLSQLLVCCIGHPTPFIKIGKFYVLCSTRMVRASKRCKLT